MRISDWSSDVCSSDLGCRAAPPVRCPSAAQSTARRASRRRSTQAWRRIRPPVWPSRAAGGAGLLSQSSCAENALALGSRREAPAKSTWNLYADQAHIRGMTTHPHASPAANAAPLADGPKDRLPVLMLGAVGVVFGDIGTSPLYALKERDRKSTRLNSSH